MDLKIPKTIHYCWFGKNPEPELMRRCVDSWKKHMPEYVIKRWDESNFDIEAYPFAKAAYEAKKWAFVSDVARLHVLYYCGGIYLDTDVEVLRSLECFLHHDAFSGFENDFLIPTGVMGSRREHPWIALLLDWYRTARFSPSSPPNTKTITELTIRYFGLEQNGRLQTLREGVVLYPSEVFCPKDYYSDRIALSKETYTIHHFAGSWHSPAQRFKLRTHRILSKVFGARIYAKILRLRHAYNG